MIVNLPLPAGNVPAHTPINLPGSGGVDPAAVNTALWRSGLIDTHGLPCTVQIAHNGLTGYSNVSVKIYGTNFDFLPDPSGGNLLGSYTPTGPNLWNNTSGGVVLNISPATQNVLGMKYVYIELTTTGNTAAGNVYIGCGVQGHP